jgi:pyruvate formate lyase activating enzyme
VIMGFNSSVAAMDQVIHFLRSGINVKKVSLLPYHRMGHGKGAMIGMENNVAEFSVPDNTCMDKLAEAFLSAGFSDLQIGG